MLAIKDMRYMGLDVGDKTIGVAISDELGMVATPLTVIRRSTSVKKDIAEIKKLAEAYQVGVIVVGLPLMLAGTVGVQAEKAKEFVEALKPHVKVPVELWDERLTTVEVERILIEADQSRENRKAVVDKLAAAVMLQSYLNRKRREVRNSEQS